MEIQFKPILLSLLLLSITQSIVLEASTETYCFNITQTDPTTYHLFYGGLAQGLQIELSVFSQNQSPIHLTGSENETQFTVEGDKTVCLKANEEGYVSLDFYPDQMQKFKNAASKYELYEVHEQILYLGEQIKHMIHHSQAQEEKESVHAMNLSKSQQIIRFYSILKVLAIGLGLGAQFYLLRKYMSL